MIELLPLDKAGDPKPDHRPLLGGNQGRNPWGTAVFTQIGTRFPPDVHLITTQLTKRLVRGGLVDGPVFECILKSLKGVAIIKPDPFAAFQSEPAVYHDAVKDYSFNEPAMDGTVSAILLFALCK